MTGPSVTIRAATPADVDDLVRLLALLFAMETDFAVDEARQRRGLAMLLASSQAVVLVAEAEGRVVGMCSGQLTISTAEGGPALLVEDMVVHAQWRGGGIGRQLLEEIGSWAVRHGATRLQLLADRDNRAGLDFYQSIGWQTTNLICLRKRAEETSTPT
ncbi:MAG: GNAT family N-acetyltransferase [Desulfobulbaceae bacterium]|nr:GNAT family N-acetyltransferase [Desulfobulbaceae bacterium]